MFTGSEDVTEVIGVEAEDQSTFALAWAYGGEVLNVGFSENASGDIVVTSVQWDKIGGGSLTNTDFRLN